MEKRLEKLEEKVDLIANNHLAHIKEDFFDLKSTVSVVSTNVSWLIKYHWTTMTAAIGAFIAAIMGIFFK